MCRKRKRFSVSVRIGPCRPGEEDKGWIRVSKELRGGIKNRAFAKLCANGRSVRCQIRGTAVGEESVLMSEYYREQLLGQEELPKEAVHVCGEEGRWLSRLLAHASHPDAVARAAFGLGLLSVSLALFALAATAFPSALGHLFTVDALVRAPATAASVLLYAIATALCIYACGALLR
jgi:hypothetical protein